VAEFKRCGLMDKEPCLESWLSAGSRTCWTGRKTLETWLCPAEFFQSQTGVPYFGHVGDLTALELHHVHVIRADSMARRRNRPALSRVAPHTGRISNFCGPVGDVIEPADVYCSQTDSCEPLTCVQARHPVLARLEFARQAW
jgi:hypothetical protein